MPVGKESIRRASGAGKRTSAAAEAAEGLTEAAVKEDAAPEKDGAQAGEPVRKKTRTRTKKAVEEKNEAADAGNGAAAGIENQEEAGKASGSRKISVGEELPVYLL
ncbi:MAG: hypothetical protein IIY55_09005 [Blautia sp.]|nr:hypothetical protein [Blautia sp.]